MDVLAEGVDDSSQADFAAVLYLDSVYQIFEANFL
jgi:hypothetical protein